MSIDCVDRFAPEKQVVAFENQGKWINNQIKFAMVRRKEIFQRWISQPTKIIRAALDDSTLKLII